MMPTSPTYIAAQEKALGWEPTEEVYQVSGAEAAKFLNSYVTQDVLKMPAGRVALAAFLTQKGKLISEAEVLRLADGFLLIFPSGFGAKVESHLATFLLFAAVELKKSEAWKSFALIGPAAAALLEKTFGEALAPEAGMLHSRNFEGHEVQLFYTERFGVPGWELLVPAGAAEAWRRRMESWKAEGLMLTADPATLEILRVEAGIPAMGVDMSEENLVAEVGLDLSATSFNKGCYLGQETTARVQSRGHVNRKLTKLRLEAQPKGLPTELFQGEKKVGSLSSAVDSPKLGGILGLGTVALAAWENPGKIFFKDEGREISIERLP